MTEEEGRGYIFEKVKDERVFSLILQERWWTESLAREFSCFFDRLDWALLDIYHKEIFSIDFAREMKNKIKDEGEDLFWHGKKL